MAAETKHAGVSSGHNFTDEENASVVEAKVGKVSDWDNDVMREVQVGDAKVLVVKTKSGLRACGRSCTHYGAPLIKGVVSGDRVVCPWHGACFNVASGDIEDAPALDPIPTYPLRVDHDDVYVKVPQTDKHTGNIQRRDKVTARSTSGLLNTPASDKRHFVIIGGGAAGHTCAESLRALGFTGQITMVCREKVLPYDRTKVSKAAHMPADKIELRSNAWFAENKIDLLLGVTATSIDSAKKNVSLDDGRTLKYDEVLVATGASARKFTEDKLPGCNKKNVFYIRNPEDSAALWSAVQAIGAEKVQAVILGSGFIGLEIAGWMVSKQVPGASITVVDVIKNAPFSHIFGQELGEDVQRSCEAKNMSFRMDNSITSIEGKDDQVSSVTLRDGSHLDANIVVIGIGAVINTDFLKADKRISLGDRGEVIVDATMRDTSSGIFAAGDIAMCPQGNVEKARIEHWDVAQNHARVAAMNMIGVGNGPVVPATPYICGAVRSVSAGSSKEERQAEAHLKSTPYFWTSVFGSIRSCGYSAGFDEVVVLGQLPRNSKCVAFQFKEKKLLAVVSRNMDPYTSASAELLRSGTAPSYDEVLAAKASIADRVSKGADYDVAIVDVLQELLLDRLKK